MTLDEAKALIGRTVSFHLRGVDAFTGENINTVVSGYVKDAGRRHPLGPGSPGPWGVDIYVPSRNETFFSTKLEGLLFEE